MRKGLGMSIRGCPAPVHIPTLHQAVPMLERTQAGSLQATEIWVTRHTARRWGLPHPTQWGEAP